MSISIDTSVHNWSKKKETKKIFLQENLNSVERFFRIPLYVEKQGNKDVNYSAKIAMESFINDTMIID